MEIKNSEWIAFAEFIAGQSTHMVSNFVEDGTYICCPFSTIERAYAAFSIWRTCHSQCEVAKFYDVKFWEQSPDYDPREEDFRDMEEDVECTRKQEEIEICYEQQYPDCVWQDEWDNYVPNREKQITRIAHELANKYGRIPVFGGKMSWMDVTFGFFKPYELSHGERELFVSEYYTQLYLNGYSLVVKY